MLIRHDDALGPYHLVEDPWNEPHESHRTWAQALIPLPRKVYLTGERAEILGQGFIDNVLSVFGTVERATFLENRFLEFRTYVNRSTEYKESVVARLPEKVASLYRMTHMPRYIWVVEVIDADEMLHGKPCCVGEVIIDATAHHLKNDLDDARDSFVHIAGAAVQTTIDHEETRSVHGVSSIHIPQVVP